MKEMSQEKKDYIVEVLSEEKNPAIEDPAHLLESVAAFQAKKEAREAEKYEENRVLVPQNTLRALIAIYLGYVVFSVIRGFIRDEIVGNMRYFMGAAILLFIAGALWLLWPIFKHSRKGKTK